MSIVVIIAGISLILSIKIYELRVSFSMPEGSDKETNISYPPDPNDSFMIKDKSPDIPSGLHTLEQGSSSIKITSEEIRDGAGRIIKRNRWS